MKRIPVTKDSYQATPVSRAKSKMGIPQAHVGKVDKVKTRQAAVMGGAGFGWNTFSGNGMNTSVYNNSYANMGQGSGAFGDVPLYFAMMNQNNGGVLYWPVTLKEKFEWYRYFARSDPFVKRAVCLNTDLPMSRLILRMPQMKDKKRKAKILRKYENMVKKLKLFDKLHSILFEINVLGNCFAYVEYDEEKKEWAKIYIMPPEEIVVSKIPMSDISKIQWCPELLKNVLNRFTIPVKTPEDYKRFVDGLDEGEKEVMENIPYEAVQQLVENRGTLVMDTDPYSGEANEVGTFCYHFADKRHEYHDLGVSPLECVLVPLLMKEHYKYTQLSLASRNMTPRNKISAPEIDSVALEDLREQIDMSMLNPDYTIVTNYEWNWEQIGAENRLIDLSKEYETIENQMYAGLGVTKELLTGEGMYSGSKISIEILNTRYLLVREMLQRFVEDNLFLPIADANNFYDTDEDGNKIYYYPRLSFSRLTIRDNAEVFDSLFQLYQKGSVPIDTILDLFNLDGDEISEKLISDMFTPKDAVFNDLLRGIYAGLGDKIVEGTDLSDQIIATMLGPQGKHLTKVEPPQEEGMAGGFDNGVGDLEAPTTQDKVEDVVGTGGQDDTNTDVEVPDGGLTVADFLQEIEESDSSETSTSSSSLSSASSDVTVGDIIGEPDNQTTSQPAVKESSIVANNKNRKNK